MFKYNDGSLFKLVINSNGSENIWCKMSKSVTHKSGKIKGILTKGKVLLATFF